MSLAEDSPVHSSSSDEFAAILEEELGSASSEAFPEEEEDDDGEDDFLEGQSVKRRKVDELKSEVVSQGSIVLGAMPEQDSSEATTSEQICQPHPGFFRDMCIRCGKPKDDDSGVAFGYIHKNLELGAEEIARLRGADLKHLLSRRKLYLVLDLDHTLLNSTRIVDTSPLEEYLKNGSEPLADGLNESLFKLEHMHMLTKLRPFVRTFLKEASSMFEMFIYTMAERSYALEMASILDPERIYFSSRVISQADCTQRYQKGLDVVLGAESAVIILDDTEMVWQKHKENLILMERYNFFASSLRQFGFSGNSLAEMKRDESEEDGALASVLKVLKHAHQMFYNPELGSDVGQQDVRQLLSAIRSQILSGCRVVFSHVFPRNFPAENHQLWKLAERLGATCLVELDPSVTHVVSTDTGTDKSRWALQQKKFLVHTRWVEAANYLWQRPPEEQFPVKQK